VQLTISDEDEHYGGRIIQDFYAKLIFAELTLLRIFVRPFDGEVTGIFPYIIYSDI